MIKFELDPIGDVAMLYLTEVKAGESVKQISCEIPNTGWVVLDINKDNRVIGIEFVNATALLPSDFNAEILKRVEE